MAGLLVGAAGCETLPGTGGGSGVDHPCVGNRTDTVWLDDDDVVWVGCGSTTEGTGLYRGEALGSSWAPVGSFENFRVSHVHRASDGVLYVAGTEVGGTDRVRGIVSETELTVEFESMSQTWNSFHVGSFARTDDGLSVAESLTGADLAWRDSDEHEWADGYGWPSDDNSYQILDLIEHRGELVGVGSTITQPPTAFTQVDGSGFAMDPHVLGDFTGELWSVDSDGVGLVAGGVDQDAGQGVAFVTDDPSGTWAEFRIDDPTPTWVRGVCRDGDTVALAAEYSTLGTGLLLVSSDGGASFADQTPASAPSLSQCHIVGSTLVVAGAEGFFTALEV